MKTTRLAGLALLVTLAAACSTATPAPAATTTAPTASSTPAVTPTTPAPTPSATAEPTQEPAGSETAGARAVDVFFAREQAETYWVEPVTVTLDEPTVGVAAAAFGVLFDPGAADPPGFVRPFDDATELLGVDLDGRILTVDVSGDIRNERLGESAERALQQIVAHTGAQFDTVDAVQLVIDGGQVSDLWGFVDWAEPIEPDPFTLSPIVITSPPDGDTVPTGELDVAGEANTFEATIELRLLGPNDEVAEETFTTATCGSGCRGTWAHTFTLASPGEWTVEAIEPDPSGGEGRAPYVATVTVTAE